MKMREALVRTNSFGVYQKLTMVILAINGAFHGMQTSSNNFITGQQERWCRIENLTRFSFDQQKHIAIPYTSENEYDTCQAFDLDWQSYTDEDFVYWNRSAIEGQTEFVPCDGYVYSKDVFMETANSKWDLVCSASLLADWLSTVYVVGLVLGSFSSGRISDSLGRRTAMFIFSLILIAALFAAGFQNNAIAFLVLRFIIGLSMRGGNMCAAILLLELSGKKSREFAGVLVPGFQAIGTMICAGCAFLLRDFQLLHVVMGGIACCLLISLLVVPESPRWFLVNNKVKEAEEVMKKIGLVNKKPLPDDFTLEQQQDNEDKSKGKLSYLDLLRQPVMRKRVLILHFLWIASQFSHMSMTLNLGALTGSVYLNVFLSGITELPACIAVMYAMRYFGRTKTFMFFASLFAIFNLIAIPFELFPDLRLAGSILTILARASASGCMSDLRVLTAELFPTAVRQRIAGAMTGLSAVVGISAPFVGGPLRDIWRPLPNIIFGSLGVVAVILTFFLPDTMGYPMPDTMEDAIAVGKRKRHTSTAESIRSVSVSVDKEGVEANGVSYEMKQQDEDDDDSIDEGIIIFSF